MQDYIRSMANLARLASLSSGLEARVPIALDGSPKRGGLNPVITLRKLIQQQSLLTHGTIPASPLKLTIGILNFRLP